MKNYYFYQKYFVLIVKKLLLLLLLLRKKTTKTGELVGGCAKASTTRVRVNHRRFKLKNKIKNFYVQFCHIISVSIYFYRIIN